MCLPLAKSQTSFTVVTTSSSLAVTSETIRVVGKTLARRSVRPAAKAVPNGATALTIEQAMVAPVRGVPS